MADYQQFIPAVIASIADKQKKPDSFDETELKAVIVTAFKDAVIEIAQDSRAYLESVMVNLFEGEKYYPLKVKSGFIIQQIKSVESINSQFPSTTLISNNALTLTDCPDTDVSSAFIVHISVIPTFSICDFDDTFCHTYYTAILNNILSRLFLQKRRSWFDLPASAIHEQRAKAYIVQVEQERLQSLEPTGNGDYTHFLADLAGFLTAPSDSDPKANILREPEFRNLVRRSFIQSIQRFSRDSNLLRVKIPVSYFEGERYYSLERPDGFHIIQIEQVFQNNGTFDSGSQLGKQSITLGQCPEVDISHALDVEVSITPETHTCCVDTEFLDYYHLEILTLIRVNLYTQKQQDWYEPTLAANLLVEYKTMVSEAIYQDVKRFVPTGLGDYSSFTLDIFGNIGFRSGDDLFRSEQGFLQLVATAFKRSVLALAQDTHTLRTTVPVDFFALERSYTVAPPYGYQIIEIKEVHEDNAKFNANTLIDGSTILLSECPDDDVSHALRVEVALRPLETTCCFESEYISEHHNALLTHMLSFIFKQKMHPWYDLALAETWKKDYEKHLTRVVYEGINRYIPAGKGDYSSFVLDVFGVVGYGKEDEFTFRTEQDFLQLVATAFKRAVLTFTQDTHTLRAVVPIDFYARERSYTVKPPDGFQIVEIKQVYEDQGAYDPKTLIKDNQIYLPDCPYEDIPNALRIEVALRPLETTCCFDPEYISEHHNTILSHMLGSILKQKVHKWYDLELSVTHDSAYKSGSNLARQETINRLVDLKRGDYTSFVGAVWNMFPAKTRGNIVSESSLLAVINQVFKDSVIEFSKRSQLYHHVIMLDLYEGEQVYPISPPDGFHALSIKGIETVRSDFSWKHIVRDNVITLHSPPRCDYTHVFRVRQAIIPKHHICQFDPEFTDRYYDAILAGMIYRLASQPNKQWQSFGNVNKAEEAFTRHIAQAKRQHITTKLAVKKERLSEY